MIDRKALQNAILESDKKSLMLEAGNGDPSCRKPPPGIEELADVLDRLGDVSNGFLIRAFL